MGCIQKSHNISSVREYIPRGRTVLHAILEKHFKYFVENYEVKYAEECGKYSKNWRFEDRLLQKNESFGNSYKWAPPAGLKTKKDKISFQENAVLFYHKNTGETVFDVSVRQQKMESVKHLMFDPLKNLTFGGKLVGDNFIPAGNREGEYLSFGYKGWQIKSKSPVKKQSFEIYLHTGQYENKADWDSALEALISEYKKKKITARSETLTWWQNYWDRSFIYINLKNKDSPRFNPNRAGKILKY